MTELVKESRRGIPSGDSDPLAVFRASPKPEESNGDGKVPISARFEPEILRRIDAARAGRVVVQQVPGGKPLRRTMSRGELIRTCVMDALPRIEELVKGREPTK